MKALLPDIRHNAVQEPLSSPLVTILPCGIPYTQNFDVAHAVRFTVDYWRLTPEELRAILHFYEDNKATEFYYLWRGDSILEPRKYVAQFSRKPVYEPHYKCTDYFDANVVLACYEEIVT